MWVGPFCFTTTSSCIQPTALGVSGLTASSADLNWTAGLAETEWNVEYGTAGFAQGAGTTVNVLTTPTTNVSGLTVTTAYEFYVQAVCGAGDESLWVGPFAFTTAATCPQPTNLNVMNVTTTAANLIFQAGGTESEWAIEWGTPGFMPAMGESFGDATTTMDNPYYAEMMNPSSTYEYYVQAVCAAGDSSLWTGPFEFNTLLSNDMACNAIDLPVDGSIATHNNIGATVNGEGAIVPASGAVDGTMTWGDDAIADGPVWFSFKAPSSGNVIVSTANDITTNAGSRTEIAVYETGDCGVFSNYNLLGANGDKVAFDNGSEVALCGLTPFQTYYVMVDGYSFVDLFSTTVAFQGTFGISITDTPTAEAGTATSGEICAAAGEPVNMFDGITGWSDGNGTWYFPSATDPGAQTFAAVDDTLLLTGLTPGTPFTFDYVVLGGCNNDTVSTVITAGETPAAGSDGVLTDCNTGDVFLMEGLTGTVETGGTWSSADATADAAINGNTFEANEIVGGTDYSFDYVVTDGAFCSDTAVVVVTLDDCLGVDANEVSTLEVYPNPAHGVVTIANLNVEGNATITLVDVQGKVVYTTAITNVNGNYELDLSGFENGVYIIEITSELSTQNVRVVKH